MVGNQLAGQIANNSCPSPQLVSTSDENFNSRTVYTMDVCGVHRRYVRPTRLNATESVQFVEITTSSNVEEIVCSAAVQGGGRYVKRLFIGDQQTDLEPCLDYFASQGWRIVSQRRARLDAGFLSAIATQTVNDPYWGTEYQLQRQIQNSNQ